jgi:hypothetical protein
MAFAGIWAKTQCFLAWNLAHSAYSCVNSIMTSHCSTTLRFTFLAHGLSALFTSTQVSSHNRNNFDFISAILVPPNMFAQ